MRDDATTTITTPTTSLNFATPQFIGIMMLLLALVADAFVGNFQEKVMKEYEISQEFLIFSCYRVGWVCLLVVLIFSSELVPAISFCYRFPRVLAWLGLFTSTGYFGLVFVFTALKLFGAFVAVTITSTRKIFSITLSFFIFPKTLSLLFIVAVILVFSGVMVQIYTKNHKMIQEKLIGNIFTLPGTAKV
eukprot:TRINITY_DN6102_c0_g3_i2.p1 TRINITY_DN6102_c0_g3~~TRINITY_DN6102_c0_g3_i2.p1  ORF type:complete len:190 (-),score=40.18 TRINITY_DN6102_c0_g3_i2:123-692(-)